VTLTLTFDLLVAKLVPYRPQLIMIVPFWVFVMELFVFASNELRGGLQWLLVWPEPHIAKHSFAEIAWEWRAKGQSAYGQLRQITLADKWRHAEELVHRECTLRHCSLH